MKEGRTDDLERRWQQHQLGELAEYTRERHPLELVHFEDCGERIDALERERQLKNWSHAKKVALATKDFEALKKLARNY